MTTQDATGWHSLLPELHDAEPDAARAGRATPDQRDGSVYVLDDDLRLAIDVALAARRPLLLRGAPGSGKSSLAAFLARNLGWRYYEHVVTARTRPRDLLWTFDAVRKLADASGQQAPARSLDDHDYVDPGVLWWALDADSAGRRGRLLDGTHAGPRAAEPDEAMNAGRDHRRAVVLVDEIDKADPDLPNGLLVPLGSGEFRVEETGTLIRRHLDDVEDVRGPGALLVVITTNEERDLPPAFLRRCVAYELPQPAPERMVEIARRHLEVADLPCDDADLRLLTELAAKIQHIRTEADRQGQRQPSTAEYLDAVFACRALDVSVDDETWPRIERLVLRKDPAIQQPR